jgi:hypothetical protein
MFWPSIVVFICMAVLALRNRLLVGDFTYSDDGILLHETFLASSKQRQIRQDKGDEREY